MNFKSYIFIGIISFNISFAENKLDILSYNIHGSKTKKIAKKVDEIINKIQNYDIFFIQENWAYENLFIKKIFNHNLIFNNKKKRTIYNSGLTIGCNNKFDIIRSEEIFYDQCSGFLFRGSDCFASKGFILLRISYYGKILDLYNTHLDAGNSMKDKKVREYQLNVLKNYIIDNSMDHYIILSGDFNIDYNFNQVLINSFSDELSLEFSTNETKYPIDYIFYSDMSDIKLIDKNDYNLDGKFNCLSDHAPVSISLELNE